MPPLSFSGGASVVPLLVPRLFLKRKKTQRQPSQQHRGSDFFWTTTFCVCVRAYCLVFGLVLAIGRVSQSAHRVAGNQHMGKKVVSYWMAFFELFSFM
ncbi:hypothetical protein [Pandoravirus japonicus]|uniref:Uncharacterized protein n=1 Tax=Pandoravirus japonicus TaxID=2823154 RepID=A0A811BN50_9VIRU|nr:hypothetical protein [Pandoravirus japonicus]